MTSPSLTNDLLGLIPDAEMRLTGEHLRQVLARALAVGEQQGRESALAELLERRLDDDADLGRDTVDVTISVERAVFLRYADPIVSDDLDLTGDPDTGVSIDPVLEELRQADAQLAEMMLSVQLQEGQDALHGQKAPGDF